MIVSSCTKLFPILLIVWVYDLPSAVTAVSWAVIVNNISALEIMMDCGYAWATVLVAVGAMSRAAMGSLVLGLVGLQDRIWGDLNIHSSGIEGWLDWIYRIVRFA